jgi:hypothetical protein
MSLEDKHPEYINRLGEWIQMGDTYAGEREIKRKRVDYLPPCEGMIADGMSNPQSPGWKDYEAYLMRAVYPDVVKDAVKAMVGIMHMRPATITLPKKLQGMFTKATAQGEGLQMLLRRINEAQLKNGRCGLLVEVPTGKDAASALPYIAFYDAERITNWDAGRYEEGQNDLEMVVLDESGPSRKGFTWQTERKFRVLTRGALSAINADGEWRPTDTDEYVVAVKINEVNTPTAGDFITPQIAGRTLKKIPFVFIGANDLVPEPEVPPLIGLSNLALAIYRGEADYRQTLYYQGQQTLVIIGGNAGDTDEQIRTGNKGVIDLKLGGDAKFIGVSATGLGEMRQAVENDKAKADSMGVAFMDVGNARGESGEALRIRVAARTTTISSTNQAAGAGLEAALKFCAEWVGENPDEVKVEVQTDFADQSVAGAALLAFMQAKQLGLPLSLKSLHRTMKANDLTDMTFEEESDQIKEEAVTAVEDMADLTQVASDNNFLDEPADTTDATAGNVKTTPPIAPAGLIKPGQSVPVTPHARGTPVPMKGKVGKKGASAGK